MTDVRCKMFDVAPRSHITYHTSDFLYLFVLTLECPSDDSRSVLKIKNHQSLIINRQSPILIPHFIIQDSIFSGSIFKFHGWFNWCQMPKKAPHHRAMTGCNQKKWN